MKTSRRELLKLLGLSGAGLVVSYTLPRTATAAGATNTGWQADAFLHLSPEGELTFVFPRAEMGQGAQHGLTTLVAEELSIDPKRITVLQAPADDAFGNPAAPSNMQITGGSNSMIAHYQPLRQAGANMREALLTAAAGELGAEVSTLLLDEGYIVHNADHHPWGKFAASAAALSLSKDAAFKPADTLKYLGKDLQRTDAVAKSTGTAGFGIDVEFDGLKRAVLVRCPVMGGAPATFNGDAIATEPGVRAVVAISNGVAVVADAIWQAKSAAAKLDIEWTYPEGLRGVDSATLHLDLKRAADEDDGKSAHSNGDIETAINDADQVVEAEYWTPYLAHAAMEPLNVTIKLSADRCDVWTGHQAPGLIQGTVKTLTDLDMEQIFIHNQMLGGGFGRRATADMVYEAVEIAKATQLPVQVVWSREDDTRNDYYRPASLMRYRGALKNGDMTGLAVQRTGPSLWPHFLREMLDDVTADMLPGGLARFLGTSGAWVMNRVSVDHSSVEGLVEDYHGIDNVDVRHVLVDPGLRLGAWRSVGNSFSAFGKESFLDEMAHAAGEDPVAFRLAQLGDNPRMRAALEKVAEISDWQMRRGRGEAVGVSCHSCFGTSVAQVARVEVDGDSIMVKEVWCAVDCGQAVNPNVVRAQMQSGIIYGLSAALWGEITLKQGAVQQGNFNDYRVIRMPEAPRIEVAIVNATDSDVPLGGVGEPGTPPIAAAVANAVFAGTNTRLRELPLRFSKA